MTQRRICYRCIGDPVLQEEVRREGRQAACFYCGKRRKCISLAELANRIEEVIDKQFHLTPNYPDGYEAALASEGDWERSGELIGQVIADIAGLDGVPAEDVRELLSDRYGYEAMKGGEEDPYGSEAHYEENSPDQYNFRESWEFFSREIRFRSRFFNAHAQRALSDIFGDVATLQTWQGQKAVREITPADEGRHLYRARIAYSDRDLQDILEDPVRGLGPPPSRAATAGRMNAAGVSVFYGAKEEDTCLAEVRAPVGSYVVLGTFEIIRPVQLLDFDTLTQIYVKDSHFDAACVALVGHAAFLRNLVREMGRPVMPREEEFEYLPTQAVAEYLASCVKPRLDGIIFHSSQTDAKGRNVVLFNHARVVEPYMLPEGTTVDFHMGRVSEDDEDDNIAIFEEAPPPEPPPPQPEQGPFSFARLRPSWPFRVETVNDDLGWAPTLRLDVRRVRVLKIRSVSYDTHERQVSRSRTTKGEPGEF